MVFCRGPKHGRAANINVIDQSIAIIGGAEGRLKWIEIDHQEIDPLNVLLCHGVEMIIKIAPRQ